jgi:superfamily II DNA helicase RecQ
VYTARSGTTEQKKETLEKWTAPESEPCIVATAALAEGFDYAHVRMGINVNEPESLILLAQESGRAGRDGKPAYSLVLLSASWQAVTGVEIGYDNDGLPATPDTGLGKQRERRAMRRYLQRQQCFRTSLSVHLDDPQHRRWCMPGDIAYVVCRKSHEEPIEPRTAAREGKPMVDAFTGAAAIHRARLVERSELARYVEDFLAARGSCLLCRTIGRQWDHPFSSCEPPFGAFRNRDEARRRH